MKIGEFWDDSIVPALRDYIRIPAKSPHFDKAWQKNGYIDAAVELAGEWCRKNPVPGMKLEVVRLEGRTPVLLLDIPAFNSSSKETVLMYGHLDKQPEMVGWKEGYGPWEPVIAEGKLYGRADPGFEEIQIRWEVVAAAFLAALDQDDDPGMRALLLVEGL